MYAASATTLVQVVTFHHERRYWRTIDGALSELQRAMEGALLPPFTLYFSVESVSLVSGSG